MLQSTSDPGIQLDPENWVRFNHSIDGTQTTLASPKLLDTWRCKAEYVASSNGIEHKFIISLESINDNSVDSIRVFLRDDEDKGYFVEFRPGVTVIFKTSQRSISINYTMANDVEGSLLQDLLSYTSRCENVTIRSGGKTFAISKLILLARSSVFFAHDSHAHGSIDELDLDEYSSSDVKAFVDFLTTDVVTNLSIHVYGLFELANRYNIIRLMSICVNFLSATIDLENYQKVLNIAVKYNCGPLLIAVGKFLRSPEKADLTIN